MVKFYPVRYADKEYPRDIKPMIQEVPANFFRQTLDKTELPYLSLHTDPGHRWPRDKILSSELLNEFQTIRDRDNMFDKGDYFVSQLWFDEKWSKEFADFLVRMAEGTDKIIKVIEIHPPFDNYCDSLDTFLKIYKVFEKKVLKEFPSAIINIENRCNPKPHLKGGKFIVSTNEDIINLAKLIPKHEVKLQLVIDIPQLLTAHYKRKSLSESMIREALSPLQGIRGLISSTHIWGSNIINQKYVPHSGDFNTYIKDKNVKKFFLEEIYKLFDDDKERYFVPEVNKHIYVKSIIYDLRSVGIEFEP
jgi:hypothetical protein